MLTSEVARCLAYTPEYVRVLENKGLLRATRTATGVRIFTSATVERYARARDAKRAQENATEAGTPRGEE